MPLILKWKMWLMIQFSITEFICSILCWIKIKIYTWHSNWFTITGYNHIAKKVTQVLTCGFIHVQVPKEDTRYIMQNNPNSWIFIALHIKRFASMLNQNRRKISFILYMLSGVSFDCLVSAVALSSRKIHLFFLLWNIQIVCK